jgi:hypothetical protein
MDGAMSDAIGGAMGGAIGDAMGGVMGGVMGGAMGGAIGDAMGGAIGDAMDVVRGGAARRTIHGSPAADLQAARRAFRMCIPDFISPRCGLQGAPPIPLGADQGRMAQSPTRFRRGEAKSAPIALPHPG